MCLELGECHFDWIEIRAIGRQEEKPGAAFLEDRRSFLAFVAGKIIEDHHIARLQCRRELGFHIGFKDFPVHRLVDDPGRRQAVASQGRDEGLGRPMPKRCVRPDALSSLGPTAQARHLRRRSRLVNKDKSMRLLAHSRLSVNPPDPAITRYLATTDFGRKKRFF